MMTQLDIMKSTSINHLGTTAPAAAATGGAAAAATAWGLRQGNNRMAGLLQPIGSQHWRSLGFRLSQSKNNQQKMNGDFQLFAFFSSRGSEHHHAIASLIWRTIFVTTETGQALQQAAIIIWFDKPFSLAAA